MSFGSYSDTVPGKLRLSGGLEILELEERLETVRFSQLGTTASRRCDRNDDCRSSQCRPN